MKIFKRILSKKGLTLVEILVVLIITSILLLCATGMLAPVNNLLSTMKGNAQLDTTCNTINEYIRGNLEKAEKICVIPYSQIDAVKDQWKTYTDSYNASNGYVVKALGVLENYNGDFRLYDFGDVTSIDYSWGTSFTIKSDNDGSTPGNAFASLVKNRDGGGRWQNGLDGHEFHWFDAFNEPFYSTGASNDYNCSYQIAFELKSGDTSYLTISGQMFKRIGVNKPSHQSGGVTYFEQLAKYEPTNQLKQISFRLMNGKATLDRSSDVNSVDVVDGVKYIKLAPDPNAVLDSDNSVHKQTQDGLVILYVERDIEAYYAL